MQISLVDIVGTIVVTSIIGAIIWVLVTAPSHDYTREVLVAQDMVDPSFQQWASNHNYKVTCISAWDTGRISVELRDINRRQTQ